MVIISILKSKYFSLSLSPLSLSLSHTQNTYARAHMHSHKRARTHTNIHIILTHTRARAHTHTHTRTHTHTNTYTHTHTHIHTHTHKHPCAHARALNAQVLEQTPLTLCRSCTREVMNMSSKGESSFFRISCTIAQFIYARKQTDSSYTHADKKTNTHA